MQRTSELGQVAQTNDDVRIVRATVPRDAADLGDAVAVGDARVGKETEIGNQIGFEFEKRNRQTSARKSTPVAALVRRQSFREHESIRM